MLITLFGIFFSKSLVPKSINQALVIDIHRGGTILYPKKISKINIIAVHFRYHIIL